MIPIKQSNHFRDNNKLIAILKPYGQTSNWKIGYDYWVENFFIELLPEFCKRWSHAELLYRRRKGWIVNDKKGFHYIAVFFKLKKTHQEAKGLNEKNIFMFTIDKGITKYNWKGENLFPIPKGTNLPPKYMGDGYRFRFKEKNNDTNTS